MEKKSKRKICKDLVNVIRTVMRNNIELTNIADNKANVLLSLNALLIAFVVPMVIANIDTVSQFQLWTPITILIITSCLAIFLSVLVLIPRGISDTKEASDHRSPFFFGNFYKMKKAEFMAYFDEVVTSPEDLNDLIIEDLYCLGNVLGQKMIMIRWAFRIFLVGFFISILTTIILVYIYG